MNEDWKTAVEAAFISDAGANIQFTGCDLYDKKTRLEVRYSKNGVPSAVCLRHTGHKVFDPNNLRQEASDLGKQAALRG